MGLLKSYLRSRAKAIVVYILIAGAFAAAYLLFDMPVIVVTYPLILSIMIGVAALAIDYMPIGWRRTISRSSLNFRTRRSSQQFTRQKSITI